MTNHIITLNEGIEWQFVGFGNDTSGNEIWVISTKKSPGDYTNVYQNDNNLYIIPNGTISQIKHDINQIKDDIDHQAKFGTRSYRNAVVLNGIQYISGIAYGPDKNNVGQNWWYIHYYIQYYGGIYYKFQVELSPEGKYKLSQLTQTSDPFPYDSIENWRWDKDPGNGIDDNSYIITKKYPNNITFEASYSKFKYNDKEIYSSGDIYGFCYNQKGRIMICQKWMASRLVLITIPELYFREILP